MGRFIQYSTKDSRYDGAFDSKVGWSAAGMGDVIVTEGGKLIVIDGGNVCDAESFLELLESCSPSGRAEVELWIVTHPHGDHYGALGEIADSPDLSSRLSVKKFVYWFPDEFLDKGGNKNCLDYGNRDMERIRARFGAEYEQPRRDQKISIDDMEIHFIYVPDDCSIFDTAGGNSNCCSLIFTVEGKNKKIMITGDAFNRSLLITAWRYGYALKCDYLQMPHHGLCDTGNMSFYKRVDATDGVFIPISIAGYRTMHSDMYSGDCLCANLWAEDNAKAVYKAFDGNAEIEL